jgi:hypothetical protein
MMKIEGRCYCGALRYKADADALFTAQCHCRECQYVSGGAPNLVIGVPEAAFSYITGEPKAFRRPDLSNPVTREFCGECGTHILAKGSALPGTLILKVGTLDDPTAFTPQMAINLIDKQSFHHVPEGVPTFERFPG